MGTRKRQKRAEKRRRREQASTPRVGDRPEGLSVREVIHAARGAIGQPFLYRELLSVLAAEGPRVEVELSAVLGEAVRIAYGRNWDSAGVVRQAERRLSAAHARYAGEVMSATAAERRRVT